MILSRKQGGSTRRKIRVTDRRIPLQSGCLLTVFRNRQKSKVETTTMSFHPLVKAVWRRGSPDGGRRRDGRYRFCVPQPGDKA